MLKTLAAGALVLWSALLLAPPVGADSGGEDPALTELVRILRDQGVLNEGEYETLTAKAAKREKENWYDRIEMWGDLRARYESFYFFEDPVKAQPTFPDRHRLRYRLRLNLKGDVNDYADVFVRLTVGAGSRTTNNTLGNPIDFAPNRIFVDKAYVRVSPFKNGQLPDREGSLYFVFGRTPQPWRWDVYKDVLLWDDEISPAGLYGDTKVQLTDEFGLFGNGGLYIIDENGTPPIGVSTSKDPALTNLQIGFKAEPEQRFDIGGRVSWFYFWDLNAPFIARGVSSFNPPIPAATASAGNTPSGLTGNPNGGTLNVVEFGTYLTARLIDEWPIKIYGNFSRNLDASPAVVINAPGSLIPGTFTTGKQGTGWMVGGDIGDTKEWVRFRMLYAWLEANSFPSQFVDSDLFDGLTNRKGFVWNLTKRVMQNTDASFTAFLSDPIEKTGGYLNSLVGSERLRLQANVNYSF